MGKQLPPEALIRRAQGGDALALDQLLGLYCNYLQMLAHAQHNSQFRARFDSSDIAQETMMVAFRKFAQFQGHTEKELLAWLRTILIRNVADQVKRHQSQRRDVREQMSLEAAMARSSLDAQRFLQTSLTSPSGQAAQREQAVLLADVLARMPAQYREVIVLRHLNRLEFDQIAERMGRSKDAVRRLWVRAIERCRTDVEKTS